MATRAASLSPSPSTPIPTPSDFPIHWDDPADAALLWLWDQQHNPRPISPLGRDLLAVAFGPGMTKGERTSGMPVQERRVRFINTFMYGTVIPDVALIVDTPARMQAITTERGPTMYARWQTEYLPEIEAANARLRGFAYRDATDAEMHDLIAETVVTLERMWEIHGCIIPGFMVTTPFKQFCADRLGLSTLEAFELLQGAPTLSTESSSMLWRLVQGIPESVREVIATLPATAAHARLQETDAGRAFLTDLDGYLRVYGWRKGHFDVIGPSWAEDPSLVLDHVRLMLRVVTDPAIDQQRGAEQVEARVTAYRAQLADDPAALAQFVALHDAARQFPQLLENHNFALDQTFMALLRLPFLEVGRRMAARGVVDGAEDYAYLTLAELRAFLAGETAPYQETVTARRVEMVRWQSYVPPVAVGTRPPAGTEQMIEAAADFAGIRVEPSRDPAIVKGLAAARGTVTGTARVIRTLAEADRIVAGDILVCDMTTPAWTPFFATLGGIVADSGGPLSHCGIVAREYGIPAVVGTRTGTRVIPDGARITVDGRQGLVRIEGSHGSGSGNTELGTRGCRTV
jgi:phosphohistidine swiveling domain-containing protein